jgi:hypothetical protein
VIELKRFILAGKAGFTCTAPNGHHYTYRINRTSIKPGQKEADKVWFVNLGINYESQTYMGMLKIVDNELTDLILTKGSKVSQEAPSYIVFQAVLWDILFDDEHIHESEDGSVTTGSGIRFQHVGRCCVCGRELTNPVSIDMGIGPECAGKF